MRKELVTFDKDMDGYMEPCEGGDWVRYDDAMERIAELIAERDEARDLVKKAKCCVFVGAIDEAVARWE